MAAHWPALSVGGVASLKMQHFLTADEKAQAALLEEFLRLEPVSCALYRGAERSQFESETGQVHIRAGALVKVDVRAANADRATIGACPFSVNTGRDVRKSRASASLMSFGDGPNRCPGTAVRRTAGNCDLS
jgi:cytochrome P450